MILLPLINLKFMSKTSEQKLYKLLSEILEMDVKDINDEISVEKTVNWDSFNGLIIASELERQFEVKFLIEEIVDVKNVSDIKRHLSNHGIKF